MKPTLGSLFAGIGGFDLGFERAGFDTVWQVEIDDYCRSVLERHFPRAERFGDIRECGAHNLKPVDVICGGFPCQDISVAGKGAGINEGTRSGLWIEYSRIIRELRPRFVLVENVSALLDRGISRVLGDLAESGYDAEWQSLQAADFGLPHYRDRVWILAYPTKSRQATVFAETSLAIKESARENRQRFQPCRTRSGGTRWIPNDVVCTVNHGISFHLDGIAAGGNAVVPVIAQWIAERIKEVM